MAFQLTMKNAFKFLCLCAAVFIALVLLSIKCAAQQTNVAVIIGTNYNVFGQGDNTSMTVSNISNPSSLPFGGMGIGKPLTVFVGTNYGPTNLPLCTNYPGYSSNGVYGFLSRW